MSSRDSLVEAIINLDEPAVLKKAGEQYKIPSSGVGYIDFDFMMTIYRQSSSMPEVPWKEVKKKYNDKPMHTSKHPLLKASEISS